MLGEFGVAVEQRLHGVGDLFFGEPSHFGDLAGDLLQIGVEGAGGVIDLVVASVMVLYLGGSLALRRAISRTGR